MGSCDGAGANLRVAALSLPLHHSLHARVIARIVPGRALVHDHAVHAVMHRMHVRCVHVGHLLLVVLGLREEVSG